MDVSLVIPHGALNSGPQKVNVRIINFLSWNLEKQVNTLGEMGINQVKL